MKILFTGGGTVGHISPIIAIIREIKNKYPEEKFKFFYIGPKDKFVLELLKKEDVFVRTIFAGKIRRYFSFLNIIDLFLKLPIGIIQAFYHIYVISPDLIFSKGGYGSVPVVLMGRLFFTPVFVHESDVHPGISNQIASRFALEVFTAFPIKENTYFPPEKIISVGNPIRKEITEGTVKKAKEIFNLVGDKPVILILGGSQGAQKINNNILVIIEDLLKTFEVIHQTGKDNFNQIKKETDFLINEDLRKYYHPIGFLSDVEIASAYKVSNLIISRAGAATIFEIASVGKPSILIPLTNSANMHQFKNAYTFSKTGASIVVEEENFSPYFFLEKIKILFNDKEELEKMGKKAKDFSNIDATSVIAGYIVSYLKK